MPLKSGSSQKTIASNIAELHHGPNYAKTAAKHGKSVADKQAVAIAFSKTRGRAFGGSIPGVGGMMMGGGLPQMMGAPAGIANMGAALAPPPQNNPSAGVSSPMQTPLMGSGGSQTGIVPPQMGAGQPPQAMPPMMGANPAMMSPQMGTQMATGGRASGSGIGIGAAQRPHITRGPILSKVPGRTDAHFTHVPSGSYVIPADIVSGRGQGNTIAGATALEKLFKMGPYGSDAAPIKGGAGAPRAGKAKFKGGGHVPHHTGKPVRVNLAGGEVVVPPENLLEVVHGDLKKAHEIMDAWVLSERKKLCKTLKKLPGPVRED